MRHSAFALLLAIGTLAPQQAHAQSTEAAINARLRNQPLFLRGFWRDSNLHFDSSGHLKGNSDPVSFTVSGFELKTVAFKPNQLVLTGPRIVLEFKKNKVKRVPYRTGGPLSRREVEINITIDAPPNGDYTRALDAVIANGLAEITPSLPSYWQSYATKHFLAIGSTDPSDSFKPSSKPHPKTPNNGIAPPTLTHSVEPQFSGAARALGYGGTVLVHLWATPEGKANQVAIARPAGAGLDEQALAAVEQYTFSPATQNGKPIAFELYVAVKFQVF